jgi:hypothetical protein
MQILKFFKEKNYFLQLISPYSLKIIIPQTRNKIRRMKNCVMRFRFGEKDMRMGILDFQSNEGKGARAKARDSK